MNFIREFVQYELQLWASMTAVISIHYSETIFLFIAIYMTAHSYSVHRSSFILFQAIHRGYTPKNTVTVQKI